MKRIFLLLLALIPIIALAQTAGPIPMGSKLYEFKNGVRFDSAAFFPRRDTTNADPTMIAPGMFQWRPADQSFYGRDSTGWRKFVLSGALSDYVPTSRLINTTSPLSGGGNLSADRTLSIANAQADGENKGAATFRSDHFDDDGLGAISLDTTNGPSYTKYVSDSFYLKRKPSRIYPYSNARSYALEPSTKRLPLASDIELINFGNTAGLTFPIYQNPMALWANNWAMGFGVNVQYDSTAKRYKIFNKEYPVSYYEAGWEGVTLHTVPANQADSVDLYPHEAFQARPGIDGNPLLDVNRQYNQIKATLVARYDTSFNWQSTAYGWWGQDTRPFMWYFTERNMSNGNRFADFATYMTAATSGSKFEFSRSRGTYAAQTAVQSGDTLGNIMFRGHDGTSMLNVGRIYAHATANATTNNAPTAVTTRASNGASTAGTTTLTSSGGFGINTTTPSSALHIVKEGFGGLIYIDRYTAGLGNLPPSVYGIASNGTIASPAAVVHGDRLLSLNGGGYDGTTLDRTSRASIALTADTAWSPTAKSTRYEVYLTNIVDDSRKVFSINHAGRAAFADTTDAVAKLWVDGLFKSGIQASTGAYDLVTRNQSTGIYESVSSTTFAAASGSTNYIQNNPVGNQSGSAFRVTGTSDIVSANSVSFRVGQTGATGTNTANITLDGVDGNFSGLDYLNINQAQTGNAAMRNNHSSATFILGAGGSSAANITLKANNVSTFGGAVETPITTVTGNTTLNTGHYTVLVNNTGSVTITLPAASGVTGRIYVIKKISAASNDVVIDPNSTELIDGTSTSKTLALQWSSIIIQSNGTSWFILGGHAAATTY